MTLPWSTSKYRYSSEHCPFAKKNELLTLLVAPDGSYEDDQGDQHHTLDTVLAVISRVRIGQGVLILEEKKDKNREEYRKEERREGNV